MEFRAASSQTSRSTALLWAACGTLCAAGVWCAVSAASAMTNAHVRVQPTVGMQVAQLSVASSSHSAVARPGAAAVVLAATQDPSSATSSAQTGSSGAWAPVAAGAASLAAVAALWKKREASPSAKPAPVTEVATYATSGEALAARRNSRNMDEVALAIKEEQANTKNVTPREVVLELQRGNARFWSGMPERPEMNALERRAMIMSQAPWVCILSCADSRVPVEILFDQGLGRVFVVRVAGNILDATAMGSVEFSVKYLGVKVVMVMGHEACGAVKGAMSMSPDDIDAQPIYLQSVLRSIKSNLDLDQLKTMRDTRAQDRQAIITNCSTQVKKLQQNKVIAERVANGSVLVCGAFYEITSGMVDFFTLDKNGLVTDI